MNGEVVKKLRRMRGNRGLTLVETMLAVAVGLIVLIAAMKIYPTIERNKQEQLALEGLHQLNANVVKAFSTQGSFTGLDNPTAIKMGLVPDVFRVDASGNIRGPWNGKVDVATDTNDEQQFRITYNDLPSNICYNVVTNFLPKNLKTIYSGDKSVNIDSQSRQSMVSLAQQICGSGEKVSSVSWALSF